MSDHAKAAARKAQLRTSASAAALFPLEIPSMQPEHKLPPQLDSIVTDVRRAISARLYYPALAVALTLPDICMGLTLDADAFVKKEHYVDFVDKYTKPQELGLDSLSCFHLRGGIVHRGNAAGHPFFDATHVIFTVPESQVGIHGLTIQGRDEGKAAMLDLAQFCEGMIAAVRRWHAERHAAPNVQANIENLLSWRPNGVLPFLGGAPVVASGS